MDRPGSSERPLRVAIVGAGPSGFYAAGALLGQKDFHIEVDMFDRLPAPHGLVRYGVAPDHQKIKAVTKVFDRTAAAPRFRFFGNVDFGRDLTHTDLRRCYDAVLYAVGAQSDRKLGIPGEDLIGSLSATAFVAWYNGHPDYRDLAVDLSGQTAVVVGVGNVALDVARILARTPVELAATDIALNAEAMLASSNVTDVYVLARRGPAQVRFTPSEIREFGELADADVIIDPAELTLDPASAAEAAADPETQRNLAVLHDLAATPPAGRRRRVYFRFLVSPVEILGNAGKVAAVRIEKNVLNVAADGYLNAEGTGEFEAIPAGLVLRAVGYRGIPLPGVPFDERRGIIPNREGRVWNPATGSVIPGEYVTGWAKRGPTGVIGTNRPDANQTVEQLLADIATLKPAPDPSPAAVERILTERGVRYVSIADWRLIDEIEVARGQVQGRPRVKFTQVDEMLAVAAEERQRWR